MIRKFFFLAVLVVCFAASAVLAAKKDPEANLRTVQGVVTDAQGNVVNGAVVQLKNTKTLQIRSFITKENGTYFFHGLNTDVDYELSADYPPANAASGSKTLSAFDSRKTAVMNLKLTPKK